MADPTAILERRRAEERRRGDSTVTDLMWLGAFDPQPFTIRETGFGNTGLTVEEAPVYAAAATGFDVDAAEDTTLDQPTYAAGPAGGVEDATLTPSVRGGRAIVEPQSDNETYNLWSQTDYYSDHFREEAEGGTELGNIEESLETNAEFRSSWVRAAREVYEMHYGREISENWSDERIAEWGLDYIREFNGALVTLDVEALGLHGGMTNIALKVRGGTDAQKQAFGFLMDSLDEADITGSGALAFAGNMLVDPTTYIGIGTFGAGTAAAQGAKLAARQGVKMAVRESMRQGLRRGFSTVVREGAEAAIRAPLRSKIATAGLIAASEGAIYGVAADANMQSVNISMGRQESYSLAQAGLSAGIGFAAGGVLGAGLSGAAPYIGRGTAAVIRPVENRIIRPTVRLARDGVSRIPGLGSGFRRSVTPTDAATAATRDATEGATTRATRDAAEETTTRTTRTATDGPTGTVDGDLGASSPFEGGGVRNAFAAPGGHTPRGGFWSRLTRGPGSIRPEGNNLLPNPTRTWIHNLVNYNPYHYLGYRIGKAMGMEISDPSKSIPIDLAFDRFILPFIDAVDNRLMGKADARMTGRATTSVDINNVLAPLQTRLKDIQTRLNTSSLTPEAAKRESIDAINSFLASNRGDMKALSDSLGPIADEMALERDLAELTTRRAYEEDARPKAEAEADARAMIAAYEAKTGRTFDGADERVAAAVSGAEKQFFLTHRQAIAMSDYVNALKRSVDNVLSPDFARKYEADLDAAISAKEGPSLADEIAYPFDFLSRQAKGAEVRTRPAPTDAAGNRIKGPNGKPIPGNHDESQSILWRATQSRLEDVNAHRIAMRNGYFNPHRRTLPVSTTSQMGNMEAIIMRIEDMDPTDASKANDLEGLLKKAYNLGGEHEAIEALKRLNDKTGLSSGNHTLLDTLSANWSRAPAEIAGGGAHYKFYVQQVDAIAQVPHSPYKWGQRDVYDFYTRMSYKFRHARKYPSAGSTLSTPGKVFFWNQPSAYIRLSPAWLLGGRLTTEAVKDAHERSVDKLVVRWWDKAKADDLKGFEKTRYIGTEIAKAAFIRAPLNWVKLPFLPGYAASKFLVTNSKAVKMVWLPAGGLAALAGVEEGLEMVLPEDTWMTDEEGNIVVFGHDLDLGSRGASLFLTAGDALLAPVRWNMELTDGVIDHFDGTEDDEILFGITPDHVSLDWNLGHVNDHWLGDRFEVSAEEVRAHLENYTLTDANGMTRSFNSLPVEYQAAIVESLDAADDLSDEAINEVYQAILAAAPLPSTTTTTTTTTTPGGTTTTPGGTTTTTTTTPPPGGTVTAPPPGSPVNTTNGPSGWQSAGQVASDVGNAAFGWLGGDTVNSIGNVFSSSASWIGGMFEKLSSGKVRDGEKWLAGGFGLVAALIGTPMILKTLGLENVPFVGLVVAALVFGFGGKLAHDVMLGQGTGRNRTNGTNVPRTTHNGTPTPPKVLAQDNPGTPEYPWDSFRAADEDNNGQYAAQLSLDGDTSTFVDLKILNPTEVAALGAAGRQRLIDEANAEDRFITNDFLQGQGLDKFENWEFTATNTGTEPRPDNEVAVFAVHEASGETFVLELDAPT